MIPEDSRKKLPNLVRWFSFIRSTGPFVKVLGALELCGKEGYQCPNQNQGEKTD